MPETPDFEKMAHAIAMSVPAVTGAAFVLHRTHIAEQLRLVWNARGAADIIAIDEVGELVTAIQKLDR